jgi:hypothetical protein
MRNFDSSILQIPWPILVILLRAFGFIAPKTLKLFGFPIKIVSFIALALT